MLSLLVLLAFVAFLITNVSAQARNFSVPSIETHYAQGSNITVSFTLIDVRDNETTTQCNTSFRPSSGTTTFYPHSQASAVPCNDSEFGWYFETFDSIANFTINPIHSYSDPSFGPDSETIWGSGNPISPSTVPGYECDIVDNDGCGECYFNNVNAPIMIPVTAMD